MGLESLLKNFDAFESINEELKDFSLSIVDDLEVSHLLLIFPFGNCCFGSETRQK